MGACSSCCRRRARPSNSERQPLLQDQHDLPPPRPPLDRIVDALAAYQAGKLPSQAQINRILSVFEKRFLGSDVAGYGPLSVQGRRVVQDLRQIVDAGQKFGVDKNADDTIQDFIYRTAHLRPVPIRIDADETLSVLNQRLSNAQDKAPQLPTELELAHDASSLIHSLKSLAQLLITSSTFRLILYDLLATARQLIAQGASNVGSLAHDLEVAADDVRKVAQFGDITTLETIKEAGRQISQDVKNATSDASDGLRQAETDSAEDVRDAVISRLQEVLTLATQTPEYQSALLTILSILTKYTSKLRASADLLSEAPMSPRAPAIPVPTIDFDASLNRALSDLCTILERLAGNHSLQPIFSAFLDVTRDLLWPSSPATGAPNLQVYFARVSTFLTHSLTHPAYITSRPGTRAAERLYDEFRTLLTLEANTRWATHARALVAEIDAFVGALRADASTKNLFAAVDAFVLDTAELGMDILGLGAGALAHGTRGANAWKEEAVKDLLGWVVPLVIKALGTIPLPMPRVEFSSGTVDAAVDALWMPGSSMVTSLEAALMPDRIAVRSFNDVVVDIVPPTDTENLINGTALPMVREAQPRLRASHRIRLSADGIRFAARDVGYFGRWKGPMGFGYEDEGVVSVDMGGVGVVVELDIDTDTHDAPSPAASPGQPASPLDQPSRQHVQINSVSAHIPTLALNLAQSKHWILNKLLLQPLARTAGRYAAERVVETQVRHTVEAAVRVLSGDDQGDADERSRDDRGSVLGRLWSAVMGMVPARSGGSSDDEEEDGTDHVRVKSSTRATLKGVVHTTTTTHLAAPDAVAGANPPPESLDVLRGPELEPTIDSVQQTTIAVGAGPQLFPGKGGPYDPTVSSSPTPMTDVVGEIATEITTAAGETVEQAAHIADQVDDVRRGVERTAESVREDIERAGAREEARERAERRREGWRSRAFDV
ncbi:hypothetical protein HGRIS_014856 [Hohenbuehelia grisea]|uniref:HAM1-like N-terminal domain-containing protein n=1 Tax=Hohenbuehelia grisea TaxID=104357 RepID=A0ABR3IR05_9AGAR